jgi:ElaB/YqjD/DUF883 family membrane-anchored ribosome-binding protein
MAADKLDEVAADLDDLATEVQELREDGGDHDAEQVARIERGLEEAKDAVDDLEDADAEEQGPTVAVNHE